LLTTLLTFWAGYLLAVPMPLSHQLNLVTGKRATDQMLLKLYSDLNSDYCDEFIYTCRTPDCSFITGNDLILNIHSQLNYPHLIRA